MQSTAHTRFVSTYLIRSSKTIEEIREEFRGLELTQEWMSSLVLRVMIDLKTSVNPGLWTFEMISTNVNCWTSEMVFQFIASHDCCDSSFQMTDRDVRFLMDEFQGFRGPYGMDAHLEKVMMLAENNRDLSFTFSLQMRTLLRRIVQSQAWARHVFWAQIANAEKLSDSCFQTLPTVRQFLAQSKARKTNSSSSSSDSCTIC